MNNKYILFYAIIFIKLLIINNTALANTNIDNISSNFQLNEYDKNHLNEEYKTNKSTKIDQNNIKKISDSFQKQKNTVDRELVNLLSNELLTNNDFLLLKNNKDAPLMTYLLTKNNLFETTKLKQDLFDINQKMQRGLAASAAENSLFQPYGIGKVNLTIGMGGYGCTQAIAIGTGYRINKNTAIKCSIAYSGGTYLMYNSSLNLEW